MTNILQWAQLIASVATAIALIPAVVQLIQSNKQKRAKFIMSLYNAFTNDKEMMDMYYKIEYGNFTYNPESFHDSAEEKRLDKLLGHFNNICYLRKLDVIKDSEFQLLEYEISRVITDDNIQSYLQFLDRILQSERKNYVKYSELREYGKNLVSIKI